MNSQSDGNDAGREFTLESTRLPIWEPILWLFFMLFERLASLRRSILAHEKGISTISRLKTKGPTESRPISSMWVFAATIGELNAIEPLLNEIIAKRKELTLVLLTDHPEYLTVFQNRYLDAEVFHVSGGYREAEALAEQYLPIECLLAEIPILLSDSPARLGYSTIRVAKKYGAVCVVLNGWLYKQKPSSFSARLEVFLFRLCFLRIFDLILVQTKEVEQDLLREGADSNRIVVTGNVKYDALETIRKDSLRIDTDPILNAVRTCNRPCIIASSVTGEWEQERVLDGYCIARDQCATNPLLIIVPRYPNMKEKLTQLEGFIRSRGLAHELKTKIVPEDLMELDVLVLNTTGELRRYFAFAKIVYMGVNHNVLEPLAFSKPVLVSDGWVMGFPSYPVYHALVENNCLIVTRDASEIGAEIAFLLKNSTDYDKAIEHISETLLARRGAVSRSMQELERLKFD